MRHGTRQLLVSARHGAGHRNLTWSYAAAWPDFTPPLTPFVLVLFINGQVLHLADMSKTDCMEAADSIWAAGGEASCYPDDSPILPPAS